jgi:hypothetical protein
LTVSTKSVTEYFKERMGLVVSKPKSFDMVTDEEPRGGIGSRPKVCALDEVEEGRGLRGGLGMGLLAKMSAAEAAGEVSIQGIPEGKDKRKEARIGRESCSEGDETEARHRSRRKGKRRAKVASD